LAQASGWPLRAAVVRTNGARPAGVRSTTPSANQRPGPAGRAAISARMPTASGGASSNTTIV
jgi:hypothetical protein